MTTPVIYPASGAATANALMAPALSAAPLQRYTLQLLCKQQLHPRIIAGFQAHPQMEGMLERYLQRLSAMQPPSTFAQLCRQMNEALTAWEPLLMLQNVETLLVCSAEGEKAHQLLLYGHTAAGPVLMRCFYLRD